MLERSDFILDTAGLNVKWDQIGCQIGSERDLNLGQMVRWGRPAYPLHLAKCVESQQAYSIHWKRTQTQPKRKPIPINLNGFFLPLYNANQIEYNLKYVHQTKLISHLYGDGGPNLIHSSDLIRAYFFKCALAVLLCEQKWIGKKALFELFNRLIYWFYSNICINKLAIDV